MKDLKNKVVAITGAASGIGRMLAVNLADEGSRLALGDVDETGLRETSGLVGSKVGVSTHIVDVSDLRQVQLFADEAALHHGGVDMIINNAGVALGDFLETVPMEDFQWIVGIDFWGVVHGTMAFLPLLRKRPEGHVVNISSINGILPNPNNGPYCAAKFAVKGYTETLAQEMRGTTIRVSCVFPFQGKGAVPLRGGTLQDHCGRGGKNNHQGYQGQQETHHGGHRRQGPGYPDKAAPRHRGDPVRPGVAFPCKEIRIEGMKDLQSAFTCSSPGMVL
jgi:NAD(P)-dependent dehydrogenase (short-subunit alcohol dehydrogenase family)